MAIKLRYYCGYTDNDGVSHGCLERREAEIIYDKDGKPFVNSLKMPVTQVADFLFTLETPIVCPICGLVIKKYQIIRDRPERYVNKSGVIHIREYKDME